MGFTLFVHRNPVDFVPWIILPVQESDTARDEKNRGADRHDPHVTSNVDSIHGLALAKHFTMNPTAGPRRVAGRVHAVVRRAAITTPLNATHGRRAQPSGARGACVAPARAATSLSSGMRRRAAR